MLEIMKDCTGCGACHLICTHNAIEMKENFEGNLYPSVDDSKCVNCRACDKVCHVQNFRTTNSATPKVYAAYLKNKSELSNVSSGGVFAALAEYVITIGGVVYGVAQISLYDVRHIRVTQIEGLEALRRSKYLESTLGTTYESVRNDLRSGLTVLFSGTPCQVAGLKTFLGKKYETLFTCEVVCHGVPIWNAFRKYILEIEQEKGKKVTRIIYRDKCEGWKHNRIRLCFDDGTELSERSNENILHSGYCLGLFYRNSCMSCRYASLPRVGDITLADYWLYKGALREQNTNGGISLVLCNNVVGDHIFEMCKEQLIYDESNLKTAMQSCRHMTHQPQRNRYRNAFIRDMDAGFSSTYRKYTQKIRRDRFLVKCLIWPCLVFKKIISIFTFKGR